MREHPIPQDIVGYRFHIVGSMTLKQFAELAVGAILGLIIYSTNLPTPIKWPLILMAAALGAAAAFLPIEERPLDHWLTVFFQTLYKPTKFYWRKTSKIPAIFLFKAGQEAMDTKDEVDLSPARRERIKEYLASVKSFSTHDDDYDQANRDRVQDIMDAFDQVNTKQVKITPQATKPNLKVRARSLDKLNLEEETTILDKKNLDKKKTLLKESQVAQEVSIPDTDITKSDEINQKNPAEEVVAISQQQSIYDTSSDVSEKEASTTEEAANFNIALPFPTKPTTPNKLVGMILTPNSELIPESVIEIKDEQNRVVRAVKSNALGQFFVSTPLKEGTYTIIVNHQRYRFNPQELVLTDKVVNPIEIRSLG